MASTYSTDLRIELIGAGEQSGTWGTTTNTNLGTLIEDSISGNATISVTASPRALSALNGAVDEARQAILTLTTTLTAAFTVLAPPVSKQYVVYNNTAYTATIGNATVINGTTPTGGTTVAIPAGRTVTVWSDGVNFRVQDTNVSNINGGIAGSLAYQTAANTTALLPIGTNGQILALVSGLPAWIVQPASGAAISNDTTTTSNFFPLFASASSGTPTTIHTSNAKYTYQPATGELSAPAVISTNGISLNSETVAVNYTIPTGQNGSSVGPITINTGVTVTVSTGQRWVIT